MRYVRVTVKRDTQTTYVRDVPEWEVPMLEFIFEPGNVVRDGSKFVAVEGEYPEAADEYGRLAGAYGADRKSGVPFVASVYGEGPRGIRELKRSIEAAKADELNAAKTPTARRKAIQADPLMA